MEKINIAELLNNCPKGMELVCTTWENVTFEKVVNDDMYIFTDGSYISMGSQDNWELVPNKFDITTLKPFNNVLVRLSNNCAWMPKFFSHYNIDLKTKHYSYITTDNIGFPQCIPYNGNEHLCRKTNNCDEYYKTWND